jgi:hypothetical protein
VIGIGGPACPKPRPNRAVAATGSPLAHRALELIDAGELRFVAQPLVDSYHTVWFELHEGLLRLAGRGRGDLAHRRAGDTGTPGPTPLIG